MSSKAVFVKVSVPSEEVQKQLTNSGIALTNDFKVKNFELRFRVNTDNVQEAVDKLNNDYKFDLSSAKVFAKAFEKKATTAKTSRVSNVKKAVKKAITKSKSAKQTEKKPKTNFATVETMKVTPDPATSPDIKNPILISDATGPKGGHYYNKDIVGNYLHSISFKANKNNLLSPDFEVDNQKFKAVNVRSVINTKTNTISIAVLLFHVDTGRTGLINLRRFINADGKPETRRTNYTLLKDDKRIDIKSTELIPLYFISIDSVNIDPVTGVWDELRLAIDEAKVAANQVRFGVGKVNKKKMAFKNKKFRNSKK